MRPITKPDLNSVFESMLPLAKTNPQYINAYLLTGTPEQKLVAAMIKDMPQGQAQAAPAQAPTQTVIDQKAAQVDPGIAALPVAEGMFQGGSYATGGIIAFEEGGSIYKELYGQEPDQFGNIIIGNQLVNIRDLKLDKDLSSVGGKKPYLQKLPWKNDIPRGAVSEETKPKSGLVSPIDWNLQAQQSQLLPDAVAPQVQAPKPLAAQPVIDPNKKVGIATPKVDELSAQTPAKQRQPAAAPDIGNVSYGLPNALAGVKVPDRATLDKAAFVGEAPTMSGIQSLREEAYKKAGVSEDSYDKVMEDIKAKRGEVEGKGKDRALGEFLMNLGFGAAGGTSQFALQNFGQAAGPAGKELIGTMRDLENKKDKLNEREFAVMDARNKFRQTGADSDLRSMQESEKDYRNAKRDYAKTDSQLQDTQIGRQLSLSTAQAQEAGQNERAVLAAKLQEQGLKIQSFNAQTQRMAQDKPEIFTTILNNLETDPIYQNASGSAKNKMITEAISDSRSTSAGAGSKGFVYLKELEGEFKEPTSLIYKEYKRIEKSKGLEAAEAYRTKWISDKMATAGVPQTATTSTADPLSIL